MWVEVRYERLDTITYETCHNMGASAFHEPKKNKTQVYHLEHYMSLSLFKRRVCIILKSHHASAFDASAFEGSVFSFL